MIILPSGAPGLQDRFHSLAAMAALRGDVTYKFTGETTQFDDVLMSKGIITKEQVRWVQRNTH